MDKNLKKEVILSYEAGDWFDKIPFTNLCDGGITAINVDRRFGKSTFIVNAVKKILLQNMADYINVECGDRNRARYMKMIFKKVLGDNFEALYPRISIRPDGSGCTFEPFDKRRTVTFVDEFIFVATEHEIRKILASELNADAQTWILLDTSYEASRKLESKNSFAGLLEMPFVRSYEIVGRIPEECLAYYSDEQQQVIEERLKAFFNYQLNRH
jgi:hypothetical protein